MIKFNTVEEIKTWLGVVRSEPINNVWNTVMDSFEKSHWTSAFNFRLEKFLKGEEIGH
jgi:hypothetical protein